LTFLDKSPLRLLGFAASTLPTITQARGIEAQNSQAASRGYWCETITHNGINPTIWKSKRWAVFRNVMDYGAMGDGATDDMAAVQKAIDAGDSSGTRATVTAFGIAVQPAVVYFPTGTHSMEKHLIQPC
jgi:hypothetical protein